MRVIAIGWPICGAAALTVLSVVYDPSVWPGKVMTDSCLDLDYFAKYESANSIFCLNLLFYRKELFSFFIGVFYIIGFMAKSKYNLAFLLSDSKARQGPLVKGTFLSQSRRL